MRVFSQFSITFLVIGFISIGSAQEKAGTTLWKAFTNGVKGNKNKTTKVEALPADPQNSLASPNHAITPTGKRLQPFGQPGYWGDQPLPVQEDSIIELAPVPDLRTPDQISKVEKRRNALNAKLARRQATNLENKEKIAASRIDPNQVVTANRDPSTALRHVSSQADCAVPTGNVARPVTGNGTLLKPFNSSSTYVKNGQLVYRHNDTVFEENPQAAVPSGEDPIVELAPIPDLRTRDQITKTEIRRNKLLLKFQQRQAREDALRAR